MPIELNTKSDSLARGLAHISYTSWMTINRHQAEAASKLPQGAFSLKIEINRSFHCNAVDGSVINSLQLLIQHVNLI